MSVMLELVTNLQEKMRDDPDIYPVLPSSKVVRPSPGARLRKTGKGCNPIKGQGCTTPLLSSAVRKGNTRYGRNSRKSMPESVLLATNSDRRVIVGGKIATKRIVDSSLKKLNENIVKVSQVALVEPNVTNVGDIKYPDQGSLSTLSAHCVDNHVNRSPRQHSYSEKVSKWLEDSDHSTVTELREYRTLGHAGDPLNLPEHNDDDVLNSLAITLIPGTESVADVNDYDDTKIIDEPRPEGILKTQAPLKIFTEAKVWSVTKVVVRYLKIVTCISIVFLGLFSHIRLESWDYYEPPPT